MLCDRFKNERLKTGLNQVEFAKRFNISKQTVSNWESGKRKPDSDTLKEIANYFNVTTDYLLGNDIYVDTTDNMAHFTEEYQEYFSEDDMIKIPVIGVIKAGMPLFIQENIVDYEYVHKEELHVGGEYFYLQIKGDSMIDAKIFEGDRVLIKKQNFLEKDGDIMAVRINGDEAVLKKVFMNSFGVTLISANQNYEPKFFAHSDIDNGYVGFIGKAIEVKRKL